MKSRSLPLIGLTAVALVTAFVPAPVVSANTARVATSHHASAASRGHAPSRAGTACFSQLARDFGAGFDSQNFEPAMDAFDSQGADDFRLKSNCSVSKVAVIGDYFGPGPADSVHVTFYRNRAGFPGVIMSDQDGLSYTDRTADGDLTIALDSAVKFVAGHRYWVSVQANMSSQVGGEWQWHTSTPAKGFNSKWQNPNDGFSTGCLSYVDTLAVCFPNSSQGPDFAFALRK